MGCPKNWPTIPPTSSRFASRPCLFVSPSTNASSPGRVFLQVKDIIARMKADRAVEQIKRQMAHDTAKVTDAVRTADPGADAKSWLSS